MITGYMKEIASIRVVLVALSYGVALLEISLVLKSYSKSEFCAADEARRASTEFGLEFDAHLKPEKELVNHAAPSGFISQRQNLLRKTFINR